MMRKMMPSHPDYKAVNGHMTALNWLWNPQLFMDIGEIPEIEGRMIADEILCQLEIDLELSASAFEAFVATMPDIGDYLDADPFNEFIDTLFTGEYK